ncbi:MAG: hypothetical protein B7X55_07260 [Rhodobacterales bacterium 34-62-10]|nr:MAG: hypothetical protein B7X55_07260 [Rhodobacterales bacterium 34-62-10]
MGTFLAMIIKKTMRMSGWMKFGLGFSLAMALASCSSDGSRPLEDAYRSISTLLAGGRDPSAQDARALLTPEFITAIKVPYLLAELPSRQASATRLLFSQSGTVQDWRGPDGISVVLNDDVLIGTRGLGADLFAADPIPVANWRLGPAGSYDRVYRHLDGENREVRSSYSCRFSDGGVEQVDLISREVTTRRLVETCTPFQPDVLPVVNTYWIGIEDNIVWKSKQWVSSSVASIIISHLVR